MRSIVFKFSTLTGMLVGLPMLGVVLAGYPITRYLEFPPETRYVCHAPFSWVSFIACTLFILAVVLPIIVNSMVRIRQIKIRPSTTYTFPWWGWMGIIIGAISWILAWTRFSWFAPYQPHTFT
ncbi:MAG: hypothetical protein JRC56_01135, partial [Deltaproteobacteria bacterium]|nr:hypothetical protein [Deltaproteobacteria bacterium]